MPRFRAFLLVALVGTTSFITTPIAAQDAATEPTARERNRARRLFTRGTRESGRGDYEAAANTFRRARDLVPAPAIDYNLAAVLLELGELTEALDALSALRTRPEVDSEMRAAADALEAQVRARGGEVTVSLSGETDGVEVFVDDEATRERDFASLWLPPGEHVVRASRGDSEVARENVTVTAGDELTVRLVVAPTATETAEALPAEEQLPLEESSGSIAGKWWFWVLTGALLAGAAVLTVVLVTSASGSDPVQGDFEPGLVTLP